MARVVEELTLVSRTTRPAVINNSSSFVKSNTQFVCGRRVFDRQWCVGGVRVMKRNSQVRLDFLPPASSGLIIIIVLSVCNLVDAQLPPNADVVSPNPLSFPTENPTPECHQLSTSENPRKATKSNFKKQQAELALGTKLANQAESNVNMVTNLFILQYLNQLEQNIVSGSQLAGCFVVKVLIDPEPNAYSLPGGFIYLTTGLLQISESEGQLTGALAHETAHVTSRHMTKFLTQTRFWGRAAIFGGPAGFLLRRYVGPLLMFNLVRREEFEADRIGMQYQIAAGYDPTELWSLLQNAIPEDEEHASLLDRLLDTHPGTMVRVRRLKTLSRRLVSPHVDYLVSTEGFQEMQTRLANLTVRDHS